MEFNIEPYKQRPKLIRQTAEQIIKDFGLFGLEVTLLIIHREFTKVLTRNYFKAKKEQNGTDLS
ncbi:MAG: hypothetical protein PHD61_02455 [Bacteroidales bacterium]|nr:hypothetical protein [Lentimicrobiaceae bacterium]MDD5694150.1 hypothetical protein [Bacteroidales bacterium]